MNKIIIDAQQKIFMLQTKDSSYVFRVNKDNCLTNIHWGGRIDRLEDLPAPEKLLYYTHRPEERNLTLRQEYPAWGGPFYNEPALKVTFTDSVCTAVLKYQGFDIEKSSEYEKLIISLADNDYPLQARLHYRIFKNSDIIERWSEIINKGNASVTLNSVMSAAWHLPRIGGDYRLSHLAGRWGREGIINQQPVTQSKIVLESRTGLSGPFAMPFFALDQGNATEQNGRVWFGTVQWSGNWKITVERDAYEEVNILGGVNDFDFAWPLKPGELFTTPIFSSGLSHEGFGGASRILHHYQRRYILPPVAAEPIPLLVNTWGSLHADVDEKSVMAVMEKAAVIGAELFVIDDGWQAALGDWYPDPKKFPNGLEPVIAKAKKLGMDFGLWVEVESFEKRSRLYQEHPEWTMQFKNRKPKSSGGINRITYLINFARKDVAEYFYQSLSTLLQETGISYLKLDMNCLFTDPGWDEQPEAERQTIWYKYVENIYYLFGRLSREFPRVRIENCAGGGSRSDLGMSYYFGRINRSDNQDALDILQLHEGFTWLHLPGLAGGACHISDNTHYINHRRTPLKYQAIVGMLGSLAIGKNLPACSEEEIKEICYWGNIYKKIRHITYHGDLYRLVSHRNSYYAAFEYVSPEREEALLFLLGHSQQFYYKIPAIRLQGLDPEKKYQITVYGDSPESNGDYRTVLGRTLMEFGVQSGLRGDFDAKILHFKTVGRD